MNNQDIYNEKKLDVANNSETLNETPVKKHKKKHKKHKKENKEFEQEIETKEGENANNPTSSDLNNNIYSFINPVNEITPSDDFKPTIDENLGETTQRNDLSISNNDTVPSSKEYVPQNQINNPNIPVYSNIPQRNFGNNLVYPLVNIQNNVDYPKIQQVQKSRKKLYIGCCIGCLILLIIVIIIIVAIVVSSKKK